MKGIVTVDIGTTSVRARLYDTAARALHTAQRDNPPTHFADGRVEQDPERWRRLLREVLAACGEAAAAKGVDLLCLSVTAQRSSLIAVDRSGRPLHPAIMWQDKRTADLANEMRPHEGAVYRATGLKISPVFSAIKMTWLRRHRPEIWAKTHKLIGIQDWALHLLTGRFVSDQSFGSRTNLMNLDTRRWDADMLELFGVDEARLCELIAPGAVAGALLPEFAAATSLPSGLPVVSAGGDQQCAALGLGLFSGERAVANTGTGSYLIGHSAKPALDPAMRLSCNVSAVPQAYIVEAAVLASGAIYRWLAETFALPGKDPGSVFMALDEEAAAAPPGANGLTLLPHFKGSGAPWWDDAAKACFYNLSLGTTRGDMARAVLEAIALEMKESLEAIEALCGPVRTVNVAGGMTRSALFNQIQSDVFERPVARLAHGEATSLGAWIAAALACDLAPDHALAFARANEAGTATLYRPNDANGERYRAQAQRTAALYRALSARQVRSLFR